MKNILVANYSLKTVGGSETFTYTLIEELKKRDYNVEYFTFTKGDISNRIENNLGVNFMSRKKYDLILANHNTCVKKIFKRGFTIQTCHGIYPELEQPSRFADAHVSISNEIQNYLANKGFSSRLILNGINCNRYSIKKNINETLTTVLSLCHSNSANDILAEIAERLNFKLKIAYKYEKPIWKIEDEINEVDLVVGLGRSAYEAMACGRPVIIWDKRDYFESYGDGYIKNKLGFSIQNNCSGRYSKKTYTTKELEQEFNKYNFKDGEYFRSFAENNLNIKSTVNQYFDYLDAIKKTKNKHAAIKILKTIIPNSFIKAFFKK